MAAHWFIDETKARSLLLVVIVVDSNDLGRCRAQMTRLANLPHRKHGPIHFRNEIDSTRSRVLSAITAMPVHVALIAVPPEVRPLQARERAVRRIAELAIVEQPQRIVFERDDSLVKHDRRWLQNELQGRSNIEYQHLPRSTDPLLWVADGVAWAVQRGGKWRAMVEPLITESVAA